MTEKCEVCGRGRECRFEIACSCWYGTPCKGKVERRKIQPGQRVTYSGFDAVVVRHYEGNMYEVRVPGGLTCVDAGDLIPR